MTGDRIEIVLKASRNYGKVKVMLRVEVESRRIAAGEFERAAAGRWKVSSWDVLVNGPFVLILSLAVDMGIRWTTRCVIRLENCVTWIQFLFAVVVPRRGKARGELRTELGRS